MHLIYGAQDPRQAQRCGRVWARQSYRSASHRRRGGGDLFRELAYRWNEILQARK